MIHTALNNYLPHIKQLPVNRPFTKQDLLNESFLVKRDEGIAMYYAPHNEYINTKARLVIVGITPGWQQMKIAFEQFVTRYSSGDEIDSCLFQAKKAAGFAGSMRANLIDMLNQCDIPNTLNISNASTLFAQNRYLLHTTSIIKYPVFIQGKNYSGYKPSINRSALLRYFTSTIFPKELSRIHAPALIIPLGKKVEQTVIQLLKKQTLPYHFCLTGFPHPSGANGHRLKQFKQQKYHLQKQVNQWAKETR